MAIQVQHMELTRRPPDNYPTPKWKALSDSASLDRFLALVDSARRRQIWHCRQPNIAGANLAHKVIRTLLWQLIADDTLLFHAGLFVAATWSNTNGITESKSKHVGPTLAVVKGESLRALRELAPSRPDTGYKTMAIALLAGWERRLGDRESYEVHMHAWKALALPEHALDEDYVLTLLEATEETFREGLDEQGGVQGPNSNASTGLMIEQFGLDPAAVPAGLRGLVRNWPESRSLFVIVCRATSFDPSAADSVAQIRRLCIDTAAWSPSHTQAWKPVQAYEDCIDELEIRILYHIRAALVSLTATLVGIASQLHGVPFVTDVDAALQAHTVSCRQLGTESLITTNRLGALHGLALWCHFVLNVGGRDVESDPLLRHLVMNVNIQTWDEMRTFLEAFPWPRHELGGRGQALFEEVMAGSSRLDDITISSRC